MNNNSNLLLFITIILLIYIIKSFCFYGENFWGGVMQIPYIGQPLKTYRRTGIDATTDAPKMLINYNSCPINPY